MYVNLHGYRPCDTITTCDKSSSHTHTLSLFYFFYLKAQRIGRVYLHMLSG